MYVCGLGDVVALFLEEREKPTRYCAYAEPEVVLRADRVFLYILLYKGDVRALFLEKGESRHATALRGARSRFEGPIGSFSMYVCGLGDIRALFWR